MSTLNHFPTRRGHRVATCLLALICLPGCSVLKPKKDPSRFYVLRPLAADTGAGSSKTSSGPWVTIGPCAIASYLDRTGIVTSKSAHELEVSEFHLWAEQIDKAIPVVIADNVGTILNSKKVIAYPEAEVRAAAFRVPMMIKRFEPNENREIVLVSTWAIRAKGDDNAEVDANASRITVPIEGEPGDFGAQTAAMSKGLHKLSRQIAARLRSKMAAAEKEKQKEANP